MADWVGKARERYAASMSNYIGRNPDAVRQTTRTQLAIRLRQDFWRKNNPLRERFGHVNGALFADALDQIDWLMIADFLLGEESNDSETIVGGPRITPPVA